MFLTNKKQQQCQNNNQNNKSKTKKVRWEIAKTETTKKKNGRILQQGNE